MTDRADVTKPPACRGAAPAQYADTIQSNGFWSKWRRDGDGPRSLEQLLKQVEKGTQVRSSGHERILEELKSHRDSAEGADLKSALTWLCNAQTRLGSDPTTAHSREVLLAAYEVKRVLATAGPTPR
nr:hypothetical protein [Mycobacterium sp. E2327]